MTGTAGTRCLAVAAVAVLALTTHAGALRQSSTEMADLLILNGKV